ncbi:MAG: hypothetical protein ACREMQ_12825, partial [Longimicrobiales bacterium]
MRKDPLRVDERSTLPGAELVRQGLDDLASGSLTIAALLVSIGAPRLRRAGIAVPAALDRPEHRLYDLLRSHNSRAAHSQYNALVR